MINVLHIITDSNIGGAGHHLLALLDACGKDTVQAAVALPVGSRLVPLLAARGIPAIETPHIAEKSFSPSGVRALFRVIRTRKPVIVHTHASLSGRVAARLCGGCKIVHTRHSVFPPSPGDARFLRRWLNRWVNNTFSDAMIAVSPAAREDLLRLGAKADKIQVIYNGAPPVKAVTAAERAALRMQYDIPPDVFAVGMIARLTDVKGHDDLLDAAKTLPPGMVILMAGDGPREAHLKRRVADEHITNVRLLGFVEAVDLLENSVDALVNASFGTEATAMALVQGMSLGVPAVVSDFGGNPYVIEDGLNGLVFPARDTNRLRDALIRLRDDKPLYERLREGAKQRYRERFTAEAMAAETEALYRSLLGK